MSAVLESPELNSQETLVAAVRSPVEMAKSALADVQAALDALDARIRGCMDELDEREIARREHQLADRQAIIAGTPRPKLKLSTGSAETALPVLKAERVKLAEKVADAEGRMRAALVQEVERRHLQAQDTFADAARQLIDAWSEVVGLNALLEQAGVRSQPLPPALLGDFNVPVLGKLKPICANHWAYFVASHALDQGEGRRATWAARKTVEQDIGMVLPW